MLGQWGWQPIFLCLIVLIAGTGDNLYAEHAVTDPSLADPSTAPVLVIDQTPPRPQAAPNGAPPPQTDLQRAINEAPAPNGANLESSGDTNSEAAPKAGGAAAAAKPNDDTSASLAVLIGPLLKAAAATNGAQQDDLINLVRSLTKGNGTPSDTDAANGSGTAGDDKSNANPLGAQEKRTLLDQIDKLATVDNSLKEPLDSLRKTLEGQQTGENEGDAAQ